MRKRLNKLGFTLIELIIVVAIIGLLAAALFVAIDPAQRIAEARDAQRWSDVTAILNAILTYTVDNTTLPTGMSAMSAGYPYLLETESTAGAGAVTDATNGGCDDYQGSATTTIDTVLLGTALVDTYLSTIPVDPSETLSTATTSQYYIQRSSNGRIKVGACRTSSYAASSIEVQR